MDRHVFKLVRGGEQSDSFRVNVEFSADTFHLTVLKNSTAWTATVDQQIIRAQAKQLEVNAEEYFGKVKEFFRDSPASVEYSFSNNEFVINYSVDINVQIKYFSCKLKKANYSECVETLVDKLYSERNNSLERLIKVDAEKNKLEKSNSVLESKLTEFITRKRTEDQELYNNFVLVLNEKKRRIQHLSDLLEAFRRGRPTLNPHVPVKKRSKKAELAPQIKTEVKKEISESDSEEEYNTDEEKGRNVADEDLGDDINKNKRISDAQPSTSKFDFDLFGDDSPPRHLLPKRIKSEPIKHIDNNSSFNKPGTSNQSSRNNETSEESNSHIDNTPNVNFSTQELLDKI